jgi:hypothetical protein
MLVQPMPAARAGDSATHFLTSDDRLRKLTDLTVLVLDDHLAAEPG